MGYQPITNQAFGVITDLRNQAGTDGVAVSVNGKTSINDGGGGVYMWDSSTSTTDDGFKTLQITGVATGRWVRSINGNYDTGKNNLSGVSLQTAYVISHGLSYTPTTVQVQGESANAAIANWVSNKTSTTFTVNFASVPVVGTNNISISWVAFK